MTTTQTLFPFPQGFTNAAGQPLANGSLTFYAAGTFNLQNTYSDQALTVANPNPLPLNSAGFPSVSGTEVEVYPLSAAYDVQVLDSTGTLIHSWKNIQATAPWNTNVTAITNNAVVVGTGTSITGIGVGTNNQALMGATGGPPVFRALTSADLPTIVLAARLTANVNATTATLADLSDLTLNVQSGVNYYYRANIFTVGDATGGIKYGFAGTAVIASLRVSWICVRADGTAGTLINTETTSTTLTSNNASATGAGLATAAQLNIEGVIAVTTAGTLKLQFAQSSANGTSTTQQNSSIILLPTSN